MISMLKEATYMNRVFTRDVLNDMSDEQIERAIDGLKRVARAKDGFAAQTELCYAQREQSWRKVRKIRHAEYLKRQKTHFSR